MKFTITVNGQFAKEVTADHLLVASRLARTVAAAGAPREGGVLTVTVTGEDGSSASFSETIPPHPSLR